MTDPILLLAQQAPHMTDAELRAVLALVAIANGRPTFVATYEDIKQAAGGRLSSTDGVAKGLKGDVLEMYFGRGKRRSEWRTLCLTEQTLRLTESNGCEYPVDNSQTLRLTEGMNALMIETLRLTEQTLRLTESGDCEYPVDNSQTLRLTEQILRLTEELQNANSPFNRENTPPNRENALLNGENALLNRGNEGSTSHGRARVSSSSSFNTSSKEEKEKKEEEEEETRTPAPARAANGHGTASTGKAQSATKPPRTTRPHSEKAKLDAWLAAHAPSDDQRKAWKLLCLAGVVSPSEAMKEILANSPLKAIQEHVALRQAEPERYPVKHLITALRYGPQALPDWATAQAAEPALPKWQVKAEKEMAELGYLLEAK